MNILIIGAGHLGLEIAHQLHERHEIHILDLLPSKVAPYSTLFHTYIGNGTNPSDLNQTKIQTMELVFVLTSHDETNLMISSICKLDYNIPMVVARINDPQHAWLFTPVMGVDYGINQALILTHELLKELAYLATP